MLITRDGLRRALTGWHADLTQYRAQLDRINTLPVPDHDTGTNLLATAAELLAGATDLSGYDTFGNSGMLIGAWLDGAGTVLDAPVSLDVSVSSVSLGELARAAAAEVELAIAAPQPGLFLDYAMRAASRLAETDEGPDGDGATVVADDLRMLLIETAAAAPALRQRADSGSVGLYFLLRRLLGSGPQAADEILFEPWPGDTPSDGRVDYELAEFLFTVQFTVDGAGRAEVLSLLRRLGLDSVMLGRALHGGVRVHCHGPARLAAALAESLAACGTVRDFRAGPVYGPVYAEGPQVT
jgi:dihydroxyacetone kinase-like predicted kinase